MYLIFDTETSGKCDWKAPSDAPHQPYLAQLAALLLTSEGRVVSSINFLIKREGWSMSPEASEINGITDEMLDKYGIPLIVALSCFSNLCKCAQERIAFNIAFDDLVTQGNAKRIGRELSLSHMTPHCAMKASTERVKIPNPNYRPGRDLYKWPKLQEAFIHEFGYEFKGAHDGMIDAKACAKLDFFVRRGITLDII